VERGAGRHPHPWHLEPGRRSGGAAGRAAGEPGDRTAAFYRHLRLKSGDTVRPYDLRRSYAQWLDLARIPPFRQDYYMAHGPRDLNALYKPMREVSGISERTRRHARW
jgi:hypothetical protein